MVDEKKEEENNEKRKARQKLLTEFGVAGNDKAVESAFDAYEEWLAEHEITPSWQVVTLFLVSFLFGVIGGMLVYRFWVAG